ncbi:hypothetical protein FRC02_001753 [Tulasnella sp. 418]|nr:hypothetical protein FRC02_001753 [Tulasnella sp. 418]
MFCRDPSSSSFHSSSQRTTTHSRRRRLFTRVSDYFIKATLCLDLRVSRVGLLCNHSTYQNMSLSGSSVVHVVPSLLDTFTSITHDTPYSGSVSLINPPTQNGILVSLSITLLRFIPPTSKFC